MPPRRPARTVPTLLLPGRHEAGPGHWLGWLEEQLAAAGREVRRPEQAGATPALARWHDALRAAVGDLPADGYDVVAHGLGAVLWLHHVSDPGDSPRAARVLLAAPPAPRAGLDAGDLLPPPLDVDAVRRGADGTVLVAGEDDPLLPEGIAAEYGRPLKIATTVLPGGGHLDAAAGYAEWPAVLDWCRRDNLAFY